MRFAVSSAGKPDGERETGQARSRLVERLARALPPLGPTLAGALAWGLAMGATAFAGLWFNEWETPQRIRSVCLLFAAGGAVAFPFGFFLANLISQRRRSETAFAAAFLSLAVATVALTGAFYALQYRSYYAEWHAAAFSLTWGFQFVFTVVAALYQFAVLGLRLYFPVGFIALLAASVWFARRAR